MLPSEAACVGDAAMALTASLAAPLSGLVVYAVRGRYCEGGFESLVPCPFALHKLKMSILITAFANRHQD